MDDAHPAGSADELAKITDYLGSSPQDYGSLPENPGEVAPFEENQSKSPNNVDHDRFDTRLYGEMYEACAEVRALEDNDDAFDTFPELLSDFFYSFYKTAPTMANESFVDERCYRTNRPFVTKLLEDDETARARINTRLDDMSSALATLAAGHKVLEEIHQRPELAQFIEQATSSPDDDSAGTDPAHTTPGNSDPADAEDDDDSGQSVPEAPGEEPASEVEPTVQQLNPTSAPPRDLRRAIRAAAEAGADDAQQTQQALDGWGIGPGDLTRVPLGERIELARQLRNPRFKRLFDLVGRMRNLARAQSCEKVKSRQDEIHSIELSGELDRMLPAELSAGLASSSRLRRLDFYRRFTERQVLSYALDANEPQATGPVVAAVDCSGSMSGEKMEWATAVALALVDLACGGGASATNKRPAALVFFNEDIKKVLRFAPGERDPRRLLEVATTGASGSTRYEPVWKQLFTLSAESAHKGADLVFITDGICNVSEEFAGYIRESKEQLGATAYSVLIGESNSAELQRYSDEVWTVTDLLCSATTVAGELFSRLG